jgi:hypothetical protein
MHLALSAPALDARHHVLLHLVERDGVAAVVALARDPRMQQALAGTEPLGGVHTQHARQQVLGFGTHLGEYGP